MSKFYKTKEFKALQKEWTKKLKDSDFKDIESPNEQIKQHSDYFKNQWSQEDFETQREYFTMAERFFFEFDFKEAVDGIRDLAKRYKELALYKKIWRRYYKGMNIRKIAMNLDLTYAKTYAYVDELEKFMFRLYKVGVRDLHD